MMAWSSCRIGTTTILSGTTSRSAGHSYRCRRLRTSSVIAASLRSPTHADAEAFSGLMNHRDGSVVIDPQILQAHNTDWSNKWKGTSSILLRPHTTAEVASILKYCNEHRIGVVPQAGNTGLVGGSVPIADEVIVSVRSLNDIESLDKNGILKCGAGCILQDLQTYAASQDYMIPLDLGAKGTCCIGGNVSTNAGGQYFYRHGSMHANVLGLQVALPDGRVLDLMQNINLKDNTGYDLKQLFVGAEGTLGIVTRVALHCPRLPRARDAAFLACECYDDVQRLLRLAQDVLGEILAAFEYMDRGVLDLVKRDLSIPVRPQENDGDNDDDSSSNYPYCILVETQGSNAEHNMSKMEAFLEKAMEDGIVADGILSQDLTQVHDMWNVREHCGPAVSSTGHLYKYDISVPVAEFEDMAEETRKHLQHLSQAILVVSWGHIQDGNMHLNVVTPGVFEPDADVLDCLEPFIFESVIRRGGSISAEHGLGQCKNNYLPMCKDPVTLETMRSIKQLFDPRGIMNPGKFLPRTE